jgi:hypothetical protein
MERSTQAPPPVHERGRADESAARSRCYPGHRSGNLWLGLHYAALVRATLTVGVFRNVDEAEQWLTAQAKAIEKGGA